MRQKGPRSVQKRKRLQTFAELTNHVIGNRNRLQTFALLNRPPALLDGGPLFMGLRLVLRALLSDTEGRGKGLQPT